MFYPTMHQVIDHITNTHMVFAGTPWKDEMANILLGMHQQILKEKPLVGMTFEAVTDCTHGELNTYITIEKVIIDSDDKSISAGWEITETVREA